MTFNMLSARVTKSTLRMLTDLGRYAQAIGAEWAFTCGGEWLAGRVVAHPRDAAYIQSVLTRHGFSCFMDN